MRSGLSLESGWVEARQSQKLHPTASVTIEAAISFLTPDLHPNPNPNPTSPVLYLPEPVLNLPEQVPPLLPSCLDVVTLAADVVVRRLQQVLSLRMPTDLKFRDGE